MSKQKNKQPITHQIINLLSSSERPMKISEMVDPIDYSYKSIYTKALELMHMGLLKQGEGNDPEWSLMPGATIETLLTGQGLSVPRKAIIKEEEKGVAEEKKGRTLDQKGLFIDHLERIGVTPTDAIPSIAELFFEGDIEDMNWLKSVLHRSAAGFVNAKQMRLTIDWWAKTRGLPYDPDELVIEQAKGKVETKEEEGPSFDPGMGWKVVKDQQGDWVPIPGGPLKDYEKALEHAERLMMLRTYSRGPEEDEGAGHEDPGQEGQPLRRGGKRPESIQDYMMKKMVDGFIDGGSKKGDSEETKRLTDRIDQMERERQDERFDRLEGLVAQSLSRDPFDDFDRIQEIRRRMGVNESPVVTDQSPAVQLIKDTTDKLDKNVSRFTGVVERVLLRSGEFKPEEIRSPGEREERAGALLDEVQKGQQSRDLRRRTFGV